MGRPKKDNHPLSLRLSTPVFERFEQYCEDSGQPKTTAVERALVMFMNDYYSKQQQLETLKNK